MVAFVPRLILGAGALFLVILIAGIMLAVGSNIITTFNQSTSGAIPGSLRGTWGSVVSLTALLITMVFLFAIVGALFAIFGGFFRQQEG